MHTCQDEYIINIKCRTASPEDHLANLFLLLQRLFVVVVAVGVGHNALLNPPFFCVAVCGCKLRVCGRALRRP